MGNQTKFWELYCKTTKLILHNMTSNAPLFCGSDTLTINKIDALGIRAGHMRFLRLLM
jgi:hypothetical protein